MKVDGTIYGVVEGADGWRVCLDGIPVSKVVYRSKGEALSAAIARQGSVLVGSAA